MPEKIGSFGSEESLDIKENENLCDFYLRLRGEALQENTRGSYNSAWYNLDLFLDEVGMSLFEMSKSDVHDWCDWMKNRAISQHYAERNLQKITQIVNRLKKDNYIDGTDNPFQEVAETDPFDYDEGSVWPEIPYLDFIDGIASLRHPTTNALLMTFIKTGMRRGEIINLDERDINISHPISSIIDDPRSEIEDKQNSIYVDSAATAGKVHNGELREWSSKENSFRTIPIDQELADNLGWYLAGKCRPESVAKPLFVIDGGATAFTRIGKEHLETHIERFVRKNGWENKYVNITPHFFRHWYTTQMRSRLDPNKIPVGTVEGVVQGLRGDSEGTTIDTYTHDWIEGVEGEYQPYDVTVREAIPKVRKTFR